VTMTTSRGADGARRAGSPGSREHATGSSSIRKRMKVRKRHGQMPNAKCQSLPFDIRHPSLTRLGGLLLRFLRARSFLRTRFYQLPDLRAPQDGPLPVDLVP
jgi:hypothetical protein